MPPIGYAPFIGEKLSQSQSFDTRHRELTLLHSIPAVARSNSDVNARPAAMIFILIILKL